MTALKFCSFISEFTVDLSQQLKLNIELSEGELNRIADSWNRASSNTEQPTARHQISHNACASTLCFHSFTLYGLVIIGNKSLRRIA